MNPESLGTYENLFSGARRMPGAEQRRILVLVSSPVAGRNIELIGRNKANLRNPLNHLLI